MSKIHHQNGIDRNAEAAAINTCPFRPYDVAAATSGHLAWRKLLPARAAKGRTPEFCLLTQVMYMFFSSLFCETYVHTFGYVRTRPGRHVPSTNEPPANLARRSCGCFTSRTHQLRVRTRMTVATPNYSIQKCIGALKASVHARIST